MIVLYKINEFGEFPQNYLKSFRPISIDIPGNWFLGETPVMVQSFNMIEITEEMKENFRFLSILDTKKYKYDLYNNFFPIGEKNYIVLTDDQKIKRLEAQKYILNLIINEKLDTELKQFNFQFCQAEMNTWSTQLKEAEDYLNNNIEPILIKKLSEERNESLNEYAQKIINKSKDYNNSIGSILAKWQKRRDIIKNCTEINNDTNLFLVELIKESNNLDLLV